MAVSGSVQFGRVLEVRVKNFKQNVEVIFKNDFDIDCEFYKTIDETKEASTGKVTIMNITDETFNKINLAGCELEFLFGYSTIGLERLFLAYVISVDRIVDNSGNVATVFTVSVNFKEYYFTPVSFSARNVSLLDVLDSLQTQSGLRFEFDLGNIPQEYKQVVYQYLDTAVTSSRTFAGNLKQIVTAICNAHGLTCRGETSDGGQTFSTLTFSINDKYVSRYIDQATEPYTVVSTKNQRVEESFLKADDENKTVTIFNYETGLLQSPQTEYKLYRVPEDWALQDTDQQTFESQVRQKNQAVREADADAKRREREKKAKEKGKTLKPQKPRKKKSITIKRKFVKFRALVNPQVKPFSIIEIQSVLQENNGLFRARDIGYNISNYKPDCFMEVLAENVERNKDQVVDDSQLIQNDEIGEFGGSLGSATSIGSEGDIGE